MPAESEVFRPRRLRILTWILAGAVVVSFALLSYGLGRIGWRAWHSYDAVWMNLMSLLIAAGVLRLGAVRAEADPDGLVVRNLWRTRRLVWAQVVGVSFSPAAGDPWARLDLSDGHVLPVMAIQASEGRSAVAACERLRQWVDERG